MFNTMTLTKAAGGFLSALLFLLLTSWLASGVWHVGTSGHGEDVAQAYSIPVDTGAAAEEAPAEEVDLTALIAAADVSRGEAEFRKCQACHRLDGTDGTGPHLNGVVNRDKAAVAGFNYSSAATDMPGVWTPENLFAFIENPRGYMPGTRMAFAGIRPAEARANLIAYLETQN
ncbi:MAG: cytochrome c family protein [Paracoccus sp. (in: a-proteobacteria)]|uniref:c-type cytochrome n=1 Tax=Paracoccus sp. TaxID=267 RepID=UPI0026E038AB|nr:cytochrome c family protein [Paracoccus sp. (in: a-proteobacteria)]MDO5612104.1 cytochrome c family protein [Paracoccus sp. (in: a-proteobacteria)]